MIPVIVFKEGILTDHGIIFKAWFLGNDGAKCNYTNEYGKYVKFTDYSKLMYRRTYISNEFNNRLMDLECLYSRRQRWFK